MTRVRLLIIRNMKPRNRSSTPDCQTPYPRNGHSLYLIDPPHLVGESKHCVPHCRARNDLFFGKAGDETLLPHGTVPL